MKNVFDDWYLSDVIDEELDKRIAAGENKFFVISGVGSGKSTWVKEKLTKKGTVLFITSRKAKVEEDTKCSCFTEVMKWYSNDNQTLITNARLASMVKNITSTGLFMMDKNNQ